ncbi:MAG: glycoside hydrolase family 43 protein [Dysgonomonas sp.]
MRKTLTFVFVLLSLFILSCGSYKNENKPTAKIVTDYLPIADPYILLHEGLYYAYGTSSDQGFEVYTSTDLHYWKKHPDLVLHKDDSYGDKWFWAPEVYYIADKGKFYLYYSAEEHICVATGNSPLGPFKQSEKKPMREEKGIDSSIFIDKNGKSYIYFVRFTDGNVIWVAELEDDMMTIKEETLTKCFEVSQDWEKSLGRVVEGPSVIKRGNLYYMFYSGNDFRSHDYGVGYATSSSPMGLWTKYEGNPILQKPQLDLVGAGHGAYFTDKKGIGHYVFHTHFDTTKVAPRTLFITDLSFNKEGSIIMGKNIIKGEVVE